MWGKGLATGSSLLFGPRACYNVAVPECPARRRGRFFIVAALLALCGFAIGGGASSAGVARVQVDQISVTYIGTASLQLKGPNGSVVPSGGSMPGGTYQVLVYDDDYMSPKFTISGPGVNVSDDLNSTGMGVDHPAFLGPYTFQTNATYTIRDANMGAPAITVNTTSATSSGGSTSGGSSSSSGGSSSTGSGSSSSSGSKLLGTLKASVTLSGRATLSLGGKAVKTLKKGRYTVTVADSSKKAGLVVGATGMMANAITISSAAKVGTSSRIVSFSAGRWFFASSTHGAKTYFTVS
jgi:hypothetical protein